MPPSVARRVASCLVVLALVGAAPPLGAQDDRAQRLDQHLAGIFETAPPPPPPAARWLPDGTGYSTLEASPTLPDAVDIVRHDAVTGARAVLVAAERLRPAGRPAALAVADYTWSTDGTRLLVFTNTARVWRDETRGDYWVLDLASGRLQQLGLGAPASSLLFAKFSPDGTRVAYVRANDIHVERLTDGKVTRLTRDGSATIVNGTSDWVNEEEFFLRDCFRWSPDGRQIAYWQFDTSGVGTFSLINTTDSLYPVVTTIPYPKVGTTNSAVRIGVVDADGGRTRWMKTPGDPRNTYLARMEWLDARNLAIQQLNRLQNQNDYLQADARSGDVRPLLRESSTTWVDVVDPVRWIDDGQAFLWVSERGPWRHVYRAARSGGEPASVTRFDADVIAVAGVDEAAGWLYFLASPDNSTQCYLYRSRLDGTGAPERVTPTTQPGWHDYTIAPNGRFAFHSRSRADRPPAVDVVALDGHRTLRSLAEPPTPAASIAPLLQLSQEFFTVPAGDGVTLDGWMLKPADFDPSKHYPVIVFTYGEPWLQTVVDRWFGPFTFFNRALAAAGYVVISLDNRGTPAPKGTAWRKVVYGSVGDLSSKEQASALRALLARHPFMDASRVGIWGWSGGGTNTLNALFRFPDIYHVGVAVAPMPDQQLYDTIYQERYMGLPAQNPDGYRAGSAINFAEGLRGRLLLVHGSADDNVHMQATERLVNRLIELGKRFDLMIYPNRTHAIAEGPGTTMHVHRQIARYFLDHLPAGPRP